MAKELKNVVNDLPEDTTPDNSADFLMTYDTSASELKKVKPANILTGTSSFSTIAVSGQSNVVADSSTDTLTLANGDNISITTNATTDTITVNNHLWDSAGDHYLVWDVDENLTANRIIKITTGDGTRDLALLGDLKVNADGSVTKAAGVFVSARNETGSTIAKGAPVYISGTSNGKPLITPASSTTEATSSKTLGVAAQAISTGANGVVIVSGELIGTATDNFNTSAYAAGDKLWLGTTAGTVTTTKPTQPTHSVFIGTVIKADATEGIVLYALQNGVELEELHDVLISSVQPNDALYYDSATSLWKNAKLGTASLGGDITTAGKALLDDADNAAQRTTLGLGTIATQNSNNVSITGGTVSGITGLTLNDSSIVFEGSSADDFETTLTVTNPTADRTITLPNETGTVALRENNLSVFAATTSAQLAGVISDETGSGVLVFGTSPQFTTSVTTDSASFNVFNATATTVNAFGAATTLALGAASGTLTIGNATITGTNATTFNMNGASPSIVTSSTATASVFNTNALTGNLFGAATAVNIGAASGTLTIGNATITGTNATALNLNGASPSIATSSTGTASVFNTNALTGNLFGAATAVNIGAASGTLTIGNATITGTNATALNLNGASPSIATSSTGTASVFNTNALTGNVMNAATTASAFNAVTSLSIGNTATAAQTVNMFTASTGASTYNFASGATANATTKTLNIGTGGASGSTTNINLGSSSGGTTTVNNNLAVTGNLTVNGTTVTVNSTTITVDDPIITLGGDTAPTSDDNKDRGIEFRWHNGSAAKVGFFGYDDSIGRFTFIPDATNTSEVFSGTLGSIDVLDVFLNGTASTGSGGMVRATSPTLVTPTLGVASATSVNKVAITAPATSATLTIADGKTLTASNTLTFTGTDSSSVAFGAGGTVAYTGGTLAQFAATSSSQLAGVINDETGSGVLVFSTSPQFTTSVTTDSSSFSVFNTTATTVNAFGAATTLNIGAASGTLTIGNATITATNATAMNLNGASPSIVTSSTGTASVFNTNALTGNLFGAATAVNIGAASGTLTIGNATITGTNATALNLNGASPSIATSSTGTASVFNANALTGNIFNAATTVTAFGAATTLSVGNSATAAQTVNMFTASTGASTYNFATGATATATTKTVNLGTGGASGSTTNVNIGSANGGTTAVNNNLTVGGTATVNTTLARTVATTVSANTATTIASFDGTVYRSGEFVVQLTQGTKYRTSKLIVLHNGTVADVSEYGVLELGGLMTGIDVSASYSAGTINVTVTVTDAATTNVTAKVYATQLAV